MPPSGGHIPVLQPFSAPAKDGDGECPPPQVGPTWTGRELPAPAGKRGWSFGIRAAFTRFIPGCSAQQKIMMIMKHKTGGDKINLEKTRETRDTRHGDGPDEGNRTGHPRYQPLSIIVIRLIRSRSDVPISPAVRQRSPLGPQQHLAAHLRPQLIGALASPEPLLHHQTCRRILNASPEPKIAVRRQTSGGEPGGQTSDAGAQTAGQTDGRTDRRAEAGRHGVL